MFRALTPRDIQRAQEIYDLVFPPDLVEFLCEDQPLVTYDWRTDNDAVRHMLRWPLEGLIFDVERNGLWLDGWGKRPALAGDRAAIVHDVVAAAPRLIPIHAHRFIPAEPCLAGNPVFSVYQSDIIVYGANIADYVIRETSGWDAQPWPDDIRRIPFWSQLVSYEEE